MKKDIIWKLKYIILSNGDCSNSVIPDCLNCPLGNNEECVVPFLEIKGMDNWNERKFQKAVTLLSEMEKEIKYDE